MTEERIPRMSSVLGETGVIIGNVDGNGDLEIRGRVQGSITVSGRVLIAESGVVLGGIEATHIIVAGEVRGDLSANDGVEVHALGRVEGNIEAPRVGIEGGARVRGMLRTGGDLPSADTSGRDAEKQRHPEKKRDIDSKEASAARTRGPKSPKSKRAASERAPRDKSPDPKPSNDRPSNQRASNDVASDTKAPSGQSNTDAPKHRPEEKQPPQARRTSPPEQESRARGNGSKKQRRKGPPTPPTFVKGSKGHAK